MSGSGSVGGGGGLAGSGEGGGSGGIEGGGVSGSRPPPRKVAIKVQRNNGNMYIAVFRKRVDLRAAAAAPPLPEELSTSLAYAADAAADAGYRPLAGGERRGMTW